ncbi:MAG TPA: hypothetical protein RMH99_02860 [Sandaracinaceae bacterium LLY-WYZ-13_1]|nr:hypothetical protein [Sandaracinaceae bacterium LLY-WYZ-13_1]
MKKTTGATWMGLALVGLAVGGCYRASGDRPGEPSDPPAPDDPFRTPDAGPPPPDTPPWAPPEGGEGAPPLSGGTMAVTSDGRVLAADPATATLFLYDPGEGILGRLALGDGADPGRVAVDEAGRVHVVLRRAGELLDAAVDADGLRELSRRPVCAAPRGLAVDGDALHVACASGELVTLPAAGGAPTRVVEVDGDLRDVVVGDGVLYVSRFRAAELLTLDAAGAVIERRRPEARTSLEMRSREGPVELAPGVAYRIRRLPDGRIGMLHQRMVSTPLEVESSGYSGGDCGAGVAQTAFSIFEAAGGTPTSSGTIPGALLVDFAMDASGGQLFLVSGAVMTGATPFEVSVHAIPVAALSEPCAFFARDHGAPAHSVARLPDGRLVTQHHDTSELFVLRTDTGARIEGVTHPGAPRRDRGARGSCAAAGCPGAPLARIRASWRQNASLGPAGLPGRGASAPCLGGSQRRSEALEESVRRRVEGEAGRFCGFSRDRCWAGVARVGTECAADRHSHPQGR